MRLLLAILVLAYAAPARAQQPFSTDDADVTAAGGIHLEVFNEFDWLQPTELPHLRQNTLNVR